MSTLERGDRRYETLEEERLRRRNIDSGANLAEDDSFPIERKHSSQNLRNDPDRDDDQPDRDRRDERHGPLSYTERQERLNNLFGLRAWAATRNRKAYEIEKEELKADARKSGDKIPFSPGNVAWIALFGWWVSLSYIVLAGFMFLCCNPRYARLAWMMKDYYFYPFGKFIIRRYSDPDQASGMELSVSSAENSEAESASLLATDANSSHLQTKPREKLNVGGPRLVLWIIFAFPTIVLAHASAFILTWFSVVMMPMSKVNRTAILLALAHPLELDIVEHYPGAGADVQLFVSHAANWYYTSYQIVGMNVILVNLLFFVFITILFGYVPGMNDALPEILVFVISLLAIIPLAYYIGNAISAISARTSLAVGAVLNATFGSVIELILYFIALRQNFVDLTIASVTGGLLGNLLLLPGISMIFGGIKYKNQSFNRQSAGVSSVLLIISIIGVFTPTIFYQSYGQYSLVCTECLPLVPNQREMNCSVCHYRELTSSLDSDPDYTGKARPLMYIVAGLLPIAYFIGLLFTLKTHSEIYNPPEGEHAEGGEGHEAPVWSTKFSIAVLVASTILLALVSEELVEAIQPTIDKLHLTQVFLGISILAVVPSFAEYVNAIQFAMRKNVALSIEIGSSGAIQIALIQIPTLVFFSAFTRDFSGENSFILIFPFLNVAAVIFAVIIVNYVSIEGRSNYFLGAALVFIWLLLISAFYFMPVNNDDV